MLVAQIEMADCVCAAGSAIHYVRGRMLRKQGTRFVSYDVAQKLRPFPQVKLLVTSEVPITKVFADDPTASAHEISQHMRSVMDDLVRHISIRRPPKRC